MTCWSHVSVMSLLEGGASRLCTRAALEGAVIVIPVVLVKMSNVKTAAQMAPLPRALRPQSLQAAGLESTC